MLPTPPPPAPARPAPNVLFLLVGLILIIAGVAVMVYGVLAAVSAIPTDGPNMNDLGIGPQARRDMEPFVNGFAAVIVGCTVMTIGRYIWRGARRRGWRDRLGRLLVIVGYLIVGTALITLTQAIIAAFSTGGADASQQAVIRGLITCVAIAIPGVVIASIGFRLAKEKPLMTAEVKASL